MAATILYIEDNPQNMRLVRKMLSADGYEILEALDGATGLNIIFSTPLDLILLDINLPDIDGMEITARVKNDSRLRHIPIIALTANAMYGDRDRILAAGCDGYLAKPVSKKELSTTVQAFLGTPT